MHFIQSELSSLVTAGKVHLRKLETEVYQIAYKC